MSLADRPARSLRSDALSGVKWSAIKTWSVQGLSLIVLLIVARLLNPADFGVFAIAHVIITLLSSLADQGLSQALIQRKEIEPAHHYSVFWVAVAVAMLLAIMLIAARDWIAEVFDNPVLSEILPALAVVQMLNAAGSVANALLIRALDFRKNAIITIVSAVAGGALAVGMALEGFGVWSLVGQHLLSGLLMLVLGWLFAAWYPKTIFSLRHLREIWQFGALTMVGNIVAQMNQRIDALLIGGFMGSYAVGLFSVGRRVVQMGTETVTATVGDVAMPSFSRMQNETQRMKEAYLNAVQSIASITFPMFALLSVFADQITLLFLSEKWMAGAPVLSFLALGAMMVSVYWIGGSVLLASGRAGLRLAMPVANMLGNVVVFLLVYPYGITAVAAGFALKVYLMAPLNVYLVKRVLPVRYRELVLMLAPVVLSVAVAAMLAIAVRDFVLPTGTAWWMLIVGTMVALAAYWGVLSMTAPAVTARLLSYAREMRGKPRQSGSDGEAG